MIVYKSSHHELVDAGDYLVLRRTPVDFHTLEVMRLEHEQLISAFPSSGLGLLIDSRAARPRNDAAFEESSKTLRAHIVGTFERVALIVETVAGAMQIGRLVRDEGVSNALAFYDYDEAVTWLREGELSRTPHRAGGRG